MENDNNKFRLSKCQLEALARALLPAMREYLSSEQGKRDYEEWLAKNQNAQSDKDKR